MSTSVAFQPSTSRYRVERIKHLSRCAEELQLLTPDTAETAPLMDLVTEMARELYRIAHALDGVV